MCVDMLCGGHAYNVCDGDKGIHSRVFTRDQIAQNRGFDLIEDWLYSAAGAGFENHRYYGHDADVIMAWVAKNKVDPRECATWRFRDLRSFVYYRETDSGKEYIPGVAYGALHSEVEFVDRIVLDLRQDKAAGGARCEKCTQAFKKPAFAHKKGEECPSKKTRLGEPALAVHVKSGLTDGMDYEEKQQYFNSLASRRSKAKAKAKGRFSTMLKRDCITLLEGLGLSTEGVVAELQQRLEEALGNQAEQGKEQKKGAKKLKGAKKGAQKGAKKRHQRVEEKAARGNKKAARANARAAAPAAKRRRKAARRVDYEESDPEEADEEWQEEEEAGQESEDETVSWCCEACGHPNHGPPPGSVDFAGCELCEAGLSEEASEVEEDD